MSVRKSIAESSVIDFDIDQCKNLKLNADESSLDDSGRNASYSLLIFDSQREINLPLQQESTL